MPCRATQGNFSIQLYNTYPRMSRGCAVNVKEVRETSGAQAKDFVFAIRKDGFSGYTKAIQSMVERPDKYGIRLVARAERVIKRLFDVSPSQPRRADNRALKHKWTYRPTDRACARFKLAQMRHGITTTQGMMTLMAEEWLEMDERRANVRDREELCCPCGDAEIGA